MYSPKIDEGLIPRLYRMAKKRKVPMTTLVSTLLGEGLNEEKTVFKLTTEDVEMVADRIGIPRSKLTDDVLDRVQDGIEWGLECWDDVVQTALVETVKMKRTRRER